MNIQEAQSIARRLRDALDAADYKLRVEYAAQDARVEMRKARLVASVVGPDYGFWLTPEGYLEWTEEFELA